jgi:acetyl esterase
VGLSLGWAALTWIATKLDRPIEQVGAVRAREAMRKNVGSPKFLFGEPASVERVENATVAGVPVRRFVPQGVKPGVIAYFHGGGWVVGDLDTHEAPCRALAAQTGHTVVAVDYRLAPEHPFPAAIDDSLAVCRALAKEQPLLVAGDSAGGHLAAVVARRFASEGLALAGQALVYPVTECEQESASYERYATGFFLTRATMRWFREAFVPDAAVRAHPDASPLRAPPVQTAPAFVLLAECDVLHDEGAAYAAKLRSEGATVVMVEVPGVIHGFFSMQGMAETRDATARVAAWVRERLG